MLLREQVKEVITALVSSGWLLPRHVIEATNDAMKKLEEMEAEKPAIVRAWERMEAATADDERINAVVMFNAAFDKLTAEAKLVWAERKKGLFQKWMGNLFSATDIKTLVNEWPWHGSYFPVQDCFFALKVKVPADKHEELKRAIEARAKEYNATLE